jgi:glycosyltransferase involved in cell wall biosynthesis
VSFYFPPFDMIGCVRTGKTAAYLSRLGHEVRVVTAMEQGLPHRSLPIELPPGSVSATRWIGPRRLLDRVMTADPSPSGRSAFRETMIRFLRGIAYLPDPQVGWIPFAYQRGAQLIRESRPDVIIASSGPASSLIVASLLSKTFGIPWIADLRDLWTGNHNYPFPAWRRPLDKLIERRVLSSAAGLVTVSGPLADRLSKFGVPVEVVLNGYDDAEYAEHPPLRAPSNVLRIVYTGTIYPQQSPVPLFEAIDKLGDLKARVRVVFFGSPESVVRGSVQATKIGELIEVHPMVPRPVALEAQAGADVLLHLLWNDPQQDGIYGAKIFEYLRARRPILAVGNRSNVAARLVTERSAGLATGDSEVIARQLWKWIEILSGGDSIPELPRDASKGFSRLDQTRLLESFMMRVARPT